MNPPKFVYFDLGNVLLHFDRAIGFRRIADLLKAVSEADVRRVIFDSGLLWKHETGELDTTAFFDRVCKDLGVPSHDPRELALANADIFWPNYSIQPLLGSLAMAGHRMGILSNICESHWHWCRNQYAHVGKLFTIAALSYELGGMKPAKHVYEGAAKLAGVEAKDIFFTDDLAENVEAAQAAGWRAHLYTNTQDLIAALRSTGLQFNL